MDSDDDDDLLLGGPSFGKKQNRAATRKKAAQESFLDDCLASADQMRAADAAWAAAAQEDASMMGDQALQQKAQRVQTNTSKRKGTRQDTLDALEDFQAVDPDGVYTDLHHKRALAEALDAERSPCLGLRRTIWFRPADQMTIFRSKEEAVQALQKGVLPGLTPTELARYLKGVCEHNLLEQMLQEGLIARFAVKHQMTAVPIPLLDWLQHVAQSTGVAGSDLWKLGTGASRTLRILYQKNLRGNKILDFDELVTEMASWFSINPDEEGSDDDNGRNAGGLEHLLHSILLLITSNNKHNTSDKGSEAKPKELSSDSTSLAVYYLSRFGLDPATASTTRSSGLGRLIRETLGAITQAMADSSAGSPTTASSAFNEWVDTTTKTVFDANTFSNGLVRVAPTAEDCDDKHNWCCRSTLLALFPASTNNNRFRAMAGIRALESCLLRDDMDDVIAEFVRDAETNFTPLAIANTNNKTKKQSLVWKALLAAHAALHCAHRQGDAFILNPHRINALCDCAFFTIFAGCDLMLLIQQSSSSSSSKAVPESPTKNILAGSGNAYFSQADAQMLLQLWTASAPAQNGLLSRLSSMATNSFFRRANYYLSTLEAVTTNFLKPILEHAAGYDDDDDDDKNAANERRQSHLGEFFKSPTATTAAAANNK